MLQKTLRIKCFWKLERASPESYHFHPSQPNILAEQAFALKITRLLHLPVHVRRSLLTFRSTGLPTAAG